MPQTESCNNGFNDVDERRQTIYTEVDFSGSSKPFSQKGLAKQVSNYAKIDWQRTAALKSVSEHREREKSKMAKPPSTTSLFNKPQKSLTDPSKGWKYGLRFLKFCCIGVKDDVEQENRKLASNNYYPSMHSLTKR